MKQMAARARASFRSFMMSGRGGACRDVCAQSGCMRYLKYWAGDAFNADDWET